MKEKHKILIITLACLTAAATTAAAVPQIMPELFFTSDLCLACHNGLTTAAGEDMSFGLDWRSSMMANAARDPYWQAAVKREVMVHPQAAGIIENECSACHMPMQRFTANVMGRKGQVLAHLPLRLAQSPMDLLSADGVSCTVCHQIRADNFGQKSSFTAGFSIDKKTVLPQRPIYGPFEVDEGRRILMNSSSRFLPEEGAHIRESEHCATCHTLYTHALNDKGEVVGELPEQVPYLEWRHSSYRGSRSCQSCHMPVVDGESTISSVFGIGRHPVARHVFKGGNFFMPRVFNRNRNELAVKTLPNELDATAARAEAHLQSAAGTVCITDLTLTEARLQAWVSVRNLAGHKLPTAYPSRRAWIHFRVSDGTGRTVFESGRPLDDGSISGNDNDANAAAFEPHYDIIRAVDQVQIYEPILGDPDGKVTTVLLTASRYLKDNRLLPKGFDKEAADKDIAVKGIAREDGNFTGGADTVLYDIDLGPVANGKTGFIVKAALWYQPIGYRWAHNLSQQKAEEIDRFTRYYTEMAGTSALLISKAERRTVGSR